MSTKGSGGGRRSHNKVTALPGPVKAEVDQLLATGRHTLDEIVQHLRGLADSGEVPAAELPSRSGIGRYAQRFEKVAARMRMAREVADTWQRDILANPDSDVSHAILGMLEAATFQALAAAGEDEDGPAPDSLELLGRTAKHLEQAKTISAKRILTLRAEAAREAAARATDAAKELGLSADAADLIKKRILGLT